MIENPITSFIRWGMENPGEREAKFIDRVSETAVAAQKIVDERHNPTHRYDGWWRNERRSRGGANLYVANSAYKGKEEGCVSSFKASRYYSAESAKRRDELLAKIKAED